MDESLSDLYGYSECSGKPCYNVSCDMPGSCKSLVYTHKYGIMYSQMIRFSRRCSKRRDFIYNTRLVIYRLQLKD